MTGGMELCDFTGMEHFRQGSWRLVMTSAMGLFYDIGMEHYDDKCSGAF